MKNATGEGTGTAHSVLMPYPENMINVLRALSSCPPEYDELRHADAPYYVPWFREHSRGAVATSIYARLLYSDESQSDFSWPELHLPSSTY